MTSPIPERSIGIDEEGYALSGENRWIDEALGRELLSSLEVSETGALISRAGGVPVLVEAFDAPLVARQTEREGDRLRLLFPYGHTAIADLRTLNIDEWDRVHGLTEDGIPFVMSRPGQTSFFDLLDGFDDESVTFAGQTLPTPPTYAAQSEIGDEKFWTDIYRTEGNPRWNIAQPAPVLADMLSRLKLVKSRILVPGCGEGHDAAFFAREGHVVTAVDFSAEAIQRAKAHYGGLPNLRFVQADIFAADHEIPAGSFDVVFEHTLFCAVEPAKRDRLIKQWRKWLAPGGHLMAVFFVAEKRQGPPFGASEWELRERLCRGFSFIFWGRWKTSLPRRQGRELFVYAQKLAT